jgi:hypothetical protein
VRLNLRLEISYFKLVNASCTLNQMHFKLLTQGFGVFAQGFDAG